MNPKGRPTRKRRTREHVIADLGVNYLERFIFRCGYAALRTYGSDYGIDLIMYTYSPNGEVENGEILFQVKATDRLSIVAEGSAASFPVAIADLKYWLGEPNPVVLVVYDAAGDRAFWLDVQGYANDKGIDADDVLRDTIRVRIPMIQRVNERAVRRFRELKNRFREWGDEADG